MNIIIEYLTYTIVTGFKTLATFLFQFLIFWFGLGGTIWLFLCLPLLFDQAKANEMYYAIPPSLMWLFILWPLCGIYVVISINVIAFKKHKNFPTPLYNEVYKFFA